MPCQNGGVCQNQAPNDYKCECPYGFTGKNCETGKPLCSSQPCINGGYCHENRSNFQCLCTAGWTGQKCEINIDECSSHPCIHEGMCIDKIAGYACLCPPEWQGSRCQLDADECRGSPCLNAESCRNLVGDYICQCIQGWTGRNCEMNLNDCLSQPCAYGSTCIDGIGEYKCICPPGRTGHRCHLVFSNTALGKQCLYKKRYYEDTMEWEHDCNSCTCKNGFIECTKLWCGPNNCFIHPNVTMPAISCGANEVCLLHSDTTCFTAPCFPIGECWHIRAAYEKNPAITLTDCLPNITILNSNCAKITIFFNKSLMPVGVSVDTICHILRSIPSMRMLATNKTLIILCNLELKYPNAIVVSISAVSSHFGDVLITLVHSASETLANILSKKLSNSSLLSAVVKVKLETIITESAVEMDLSGYAIPIFCCAVGIFGTIFIMVLIFWHHQIIKRWNMNSDRSLSLLHAKDVESNNKSDSVTTRYHNPIFHTSQCQEKSVFQVGPIDNNMLPSELNELELGKEKYGKSPQRLLKSCVDFKNISKYNSSQHQSSRIKDINVELCRTRILVKTEGIVV